MKNSRKTLDKRNNLKRMWFNKLKDTDFPKEILKKCKSCKSEKMCKWNSSFTQTGKPEYRSMCNECFKRYLSENRKKTRKSINERRKINAQKTKINCIEYLGGKCTICKETDIDILTFHHIDTSDKKFDIGTFLNNGYSFSNKDLKIELDKCVIMCFNCHMKTHANERSKNNV